MSGERLRQGSDEDLAVLREKRDTLLRLRTAWLMEFDDAMRVAPDPGKWSVFQPSYWRRTSREKQLAAHLMERSDRLPLIRLALLMDFCLAQATDTLPGFLESTLPQEKGMLEGSAARFRANSTKIRLLSGDDGVSSVEAALSGLVEMTAACTSTNAQEHLFLADSDRKDDSVGESVNSDGEKTTPGDESHSIQQ